MRRAVCLLILSLLMTAGCSDDGLVAIEAEDSSFGLIPQAPKMVPFQAHEENTILCAPVTPDCAPGPDGFAHVIFPGVIEGDHIGSGTMYLESQVFFFATPFIQTAQGTITAANGDQLFVDMVGTGTVGPGPADVAFNGTWTFLGGTGRFVGASGSGMYDGTADTAAGVGQFDLDGMISR